MWIKFSKILVTMSTVVCQPTITVSGVFTKESSMFNHKLYIWLYCNVLEFKVNFFIESLALLVDTEWTKFYLPLISTFLLSKILNKII